MVFYCTSTSHRHTSKAFGCGAVVALGLYGHPLCLGQHGSVSLRELLCSPRRASSSRACCSCVAGVGTSVGAPAAGSEGQTLIPCHRAAAGPSRQRAANQSVERSRVCACECVLKSIKMAGCWRENDLFNCSVEAWPTYRETGAVCNHGECNWWEKCAGFTLCNRC